MKRKVGHSLFSLVLLPLIILSTTQCHHDIAHEAADVSPLGMASPGVSFEKVCLNSRINSTATLDDDFNASSVLVIMDGNTSGERSMAVGLGIIG